MNCQKCGALIQSNSGKSEDIKRLDYVIKRFEVRIKDYEYDLKFCKRKVKELTERRDVLKNQTD